MVFVHLYVPSTVLSSGDPRTFSGPQEAHNQGEKKQINQFLQYKVIRSYERFKRRASEKVIFLTTGKGVSDRKGRHAA